MRSASHRSAQGYSLVELLVVVIVLGLLAAIAIPMLLGQRDKAVRAGLVSDLRVLRTAQEARGLENDPRYTADLDLLEEEGYTPGDGITTEIVLTDGDNAYVACVTHGGVGEWIVYSSVAETTSTSPVSCSA